MTSDTHPAEAPTTYAGPVPSLHPPTSPATGTPRASGSWLTRRIRELGRDAALIAPGLPITLIGFAVLTALTLIGIATAAVWIGVLVLPLALLCARGFADVSRARARRWGASLAEVAPPPAGTGLRGWLRRMKDARGWLDLLFETLIALPLRTFTWGIAAAWFFGAIGGLTYFFWGSFLPQDNTGLPELIVAAWTNQPLESVDFPFVIDAGFQFCAGLLLAATLPGILHLLALLEIAAIRAGLSGGASRRGGESRGFGEGGFGPGSDGPHPTGAAPFGAPLGAEGVDGHPGTTSAPGAASMRGSTTYPAAAPATSAAPSPATSLGTIAGVSGWFWLLTVFAGIVLTAISWPVLSATYGAGVIIGMVSSLGLSAALVLAIRWPIVATLLALASAMPIMSATTSTSGLPWPWPVTTMLTMFGIQIVIGLRHHWLRATTFWFLSLVLTAASFLLPRPGGSWADVFTLSVDSGADAIDASSVFGPGTGGPPTTANSPWFDGVLSNAVVFASILSGIAIVVLLLRLWLSGRTELETERQLTAEELAKRQNLEERNRIAQELHDVVAHSMSVISVQATTARYRIPDLDAASVSEFDSIAGSARQALGEMRGLLAVLRGGREAELVPQPTVGDIPTLVSSTRDSGAEVDLDFPAGLPTGYAAETGGSSEWELPPALAALPPTTGLTAFRVVQEGLSNALRHAPGSAISVSVEVSGDALHLGVVNGPATSSTVPGTSSPGPSSAPDSAATSAVVAPRPTPTPGTGFGLRGMRERVEALGGHLQTGPLPDGGFAVEAALPLASS